MPSSIKLTEPLDILVEYGYLDEDKPYHKALNNAVMDFAEDPSLGGEYNKDYVMLLQNEAKKELKLRRRKINVSKLFGRGEKKTTANTTGTGSLAVRKQTIDPAKLVSTPAPEKTQESLAIVVRGIDSIVETLKAEKKQDTKHFSFLRKMVERFKRRRDENKLEFQIFDGLKKTATAALEPVKSAWSKLLDFLQNVILGRVLFKILEWMGNKDNKSKLESIIKFFKDWWPTLLAAYLLFGNSFGRMAVRLGVMVAKFATKLIQKLIPKLLTGLAKLKAGSLLKGGLIAGAVVGAGVGIYQMGKMMNKDKEGENIADAQNQSSEKLQEEGMDAGGAEVLSQSVTTENVNRMTQGDTNIRSNTNILQTGMDDPLGGGRFGLNKGGTVPGSGNTDTVPAMLTPGEFVMSKGAVQKYGVDTLEGLNAAAGGTNKPTLMGGYNEGGFANMTNTMTGSGGYSVSYVSPQEAKERLAAQGMPSMELMDGTVVPNFGKMGVDSFNQGIEMVREGMANNPEKIQELDNFLETNPYAQPDELQRLINRVVPGSQAQVLGDLGDSITASAKGYAGGGLVSAIKFGAKKMREMLPPPMGRKIKVVRLPSKSSQDSTNALIGSAQIPDFQVVHPARRSAKQKTLGITN